MSEEYIKENSKIYGRLGNRRLSKYENEINRCSMNLCLETPSLLSDRKTLLEKAKQAIDANGYVYKKGKSRSHKLNPSPDSDAKRIKLNKEVRLSRIEEINEKVKDITDQIGFKEKHRESANNLHHYKECDKLTEQISSLKSEKRKLDLELKCLHKKQQQSRWYHSHKKKSTSSLSSSGYECSVSSSQGSIECSEAENQSSKTMHLDSDSTATCSEGAHENRLVSSESIIINSDEDIGDGKEQTENTPDNIESPQSTDDDTESSQYF